MPFALESLRWKSRLQDHIGHQVQSGVEVVAHHFGINSKAVVAAIAFDAPAEGLDFRCNLFGSAGRGALQKHLGHQQSTAIILQALCQHAPFKHSPKFYKRQPVIFFDQQAQPICEIKFLDRFVREQFSVT